MSQDGASQFQEVIRQELELSVKKELEKILATAPSQELEVGLYDVFCFVLPHGYLLLMMMVVVMMMVHPEINKRWMKASKTKKEIVLLNFCPL